MIIDKINLKNAKIFILIHSKKSTIKKLKNIYLNLPLFKIYAENYIQKF